MASVWMYVIEITEVEKSEKKVGLRFVRPLLKSAIRFINFFFNNKIRGLSGFNSALCIKRGKPYIFTRKAPIGTAERRRLGGAARAIFHIFGLPLDLLQSGLLMIGTE